jgi:WD40 repeat protein
LEEESLIKLHSIEIEELRHNLLIGEWNNVIEKLEILETSKEDLKKIKFLIYQQVYLELLERNEEKESLKLLRTEISENTNEKNKLHKLVSLIACKSKNELYKRANWDGKNGKSRKNLLIEIQKFVSPNLMIPEDRLESILTNKSNFSLLEEKKVVKKIFPKNLFKTIEEHQDEVWFIQFSGDGKYMASCSSDKTCIVYDVEDFTPRVCIGHTGA